MVSKKKQEQLAILYKQVFEYKKQGHSYDMIADLMGKSKSWVAWVVDNKDCANIGQE